MNLFGCASWDLRNRHARGTYIPFFGRSDIVISAPGAFLWAGDHAVLQGYPAITQHIPLRIFVGLAVTPDVPDPTWKLSEYPEDHVTYSPLEDRFTPIRWRTIADSTINYPVGDAIDHFLGRILAGSNSDPLWLSILNDLSRDDLLKIEHLRTYQMRLLTLSEISRGSTNWSGAISAAIAGAIFVASQSVPPNTADVPKPDTFEPNQQLFGSPQIWSLARRLETYFQGCDPAQPQACERSSGWGPYASVLNTAYPFVYDRARYPTHHPFDPKSLIVGTNSAVRGCTVGIVRTATVRDAGRSSDVDQTLLEAARGNGAISSAFNEMALENSRRIAPQLVVEAVRATIEGDAGLADSRAPESQFLMILNNLLVEAVGERSLSPVPKALDLWYSTIATSTLNVWRALSVLTNNVDDDGDQARTRSFYRTWLRLLATSLRQANAAMLGIGRDWAEGDGVISGFYEAAQRFGIAGDSAIKIHGWGKGGSLLYVLPNRWDDEAIYTFLGQFRESAERISGGPLAFEWSSKAGFDERGVVVEKPYQTFARIVLGIRRSRSGTNSNEPVVLRLGSRDSAASASVEIFGGSGTGKTEFIKGLIYEYVERGAKVVWVWSKDKPRKGNPVGRIERPNVLSLDCCDELTETGQQSDSSDRDAIAVHAWRATLEAFSPGVVRAIDEDQLFRSLRAFVPKLEALLPLRENGKLRSGVPDLTLIGLTDWPDDFERSIATGFVFTWLQLAFRKRKEKSSDWDPRPKLVIVNDEAHRISAIGSVDRIIREGRSAGLATVLASQETRDLSSLAHADTIVAFRLDPRSASRLAGMMEPGKEARRELASDLTSLTHDRPMVFHGGRWRERAIVSRARSQPLKETEEELARLAAQTHPSHENLVADEKLAAETIEGLRD